MIAGGPVGPTAIANATILFSANKKLYFLMNIPLHIIQLLVAYEMLSISYAFYSYEITKVTSRKGPTHPNGVCVDSEACR